ncbi:MAG: oxidative damage protection protein [Myxococcota bacterium]
MSRTVQCAKLGQELHLEFAPLKGELGERIYNEISEEAWKQWIAHSIMVINEFRLNPSEPKAQEILTQQAEQFLFGDGVAPPEGFVPQK